MRILTENCNNWPLIGTNGTMGNLKENVTKKRNGVACAECPAATSVRVERKVSPVKGRKFFARVAFRFATLPAATQVIWRIADSTGTVLEFSVTSAGKLELWNAAAAAHPTGEAGPTITAEQYFTIELMWVVNAEGKGKLSWKFNGETKVAEQEMTMRNLGINQFYVGTFSTTGPAVLLDDIAVNDALGANNNSWVGIEADVEPTAPKCVLGCVVDGDVYSIGQPDAPYSKATFEKFVEHAGKYHALIHFSDPWKPAAEGNKLEWDGFGTASPHCVELGVSALKTIGSTLTQLNEVAEGKLDTKIEEWAAKAKEFGRVVYVRLWWEANINGWEWAKAAKYKEAWQRFVTKARAVASNLRFVYCPNYCEYGTEAETLIGTQYPGDAYVDFVALDGYSGTNPLKPYNHWHPSEVFVPAYEKLTEITTKPFMICETACSEFGLSKPGWIKALFRTTLPFDLPEVKYVLWYNNNIVQGEGRLDWPIESTEAATKAYKEAVASAYYYPASPGVTTIAATNIGKNKAKLRAKVKTNGLITTYYFKIWKASQVEAEATHVPAVAEQAGEGVEEVELNAMATGLESNTSYKYRVVGVNAF